MGETKTIPLGQRLKMLFFKDAKFLSSKKEINWSFIKTIGIIGVIVLVFVLLMLPQPAPQVSEFHNKVDKVTETATTKTEEPNPNMDTWEQMKASQSSASSALRSVNSYSNYLGGGPSQSSGSSKNYNSSMIFSRSGSDSRLSLPSGTAFKVRLTSKVTVSTEAMPVQGIISSDVSHDSRLAIPSGSKLFGQATFDESTEKAQIVWQSIVMNDNRRRDIQAIAVTDDGQAGVYGSVRSNTLKNAAGKTITTFIGAYAEGSMKRSMLGVSEGGVENGLKQAISETAKDQAEHWGNDLQKEKKWVEISSGTEAQTVITAPFQFRDVGVTY